MRHPLVPPSVAYLAVTVLHDLDHVRQGRGLPVELHVVGTVALLTGAALVALAARGHRLAPEAAIVVGFGAVLGLVAVHLAPHWSIFSDPYQDANADVPSYAIVFANMAAGAWLAVSGLRSRERVTAA